MAFGNAIPPTQMKYYYGKITRGNAELILNQRNCQEGLYLLRDSIDKIGSYALSICHLGKVHHYSIGKQPDGQFMIQDGKRFPGPVELINHHERELDGFLTRATIPCVRSMNEEPMAWPYFTARELEYALHNKAEEEKIRNGRLQLAFSTHRNKLVQQVAEELHLHQPWFHAGIVRDKADELMAQSGHRDGKFLIRAKDRLSYVLCLSYLNDTRHYKISKFKYGNDFFLAIDEGPRFKNLMDLMGHYHNRTDGLFCKLTCYCEREGFVKKDSLPLSPCDTYGVNEPAASVEDNAKFLQRRNTTSYSHGFDSQDPIMDAGWDESVTGSIAINNGFDGGVEEVYVEDIYNEVPRSEEVFNLPRSQLEICDNIGCGFFGSVQKGFYRCKGEQIPVAIKSLKSEENLSADSDIMIEAKVMWNLDHTNIIRLIGVCKEQHPLMMVMELAPLGQLNVYLQKHPEFPQKSALLLIYQVAQGMVYLEKQNLVHRDLAARNVLLVNTSHAKISDFGMSKALGMHTAYYQAEKHGKWPLKWYAPECIYYCKFDSKSDVWSYGVTLWEVMSGGSKPYQGMKGRSILEYVEKGKRLCCPFNCPLAVYDVMLQCWNFSKDERPTFSAIERKMFQFL